MLALIRKLVHLPASLKELSSFNLLEENLFSGFAALRGKKSPQAPVRLLVQCVEDPFYLALFGQIACSLSTERPIRVEQYVLRSLNVGEAGSLRRFLQRRWLVNPVLNRKWSRLYGSFCDAIAYSSTSLQPVHDLADLHRAWREWRRLANREMLLDLTLGGIEVGDLVNDSYLRFRPAPAVELSDPYLLILIWQACRDIRRAEAYFANAKPGLYLSSYSTYIQHGIPVRVALKHGVDVYAFGNYQEFTKKLTRNDLYHTKNPEDYAAEFLKKESQQEKLALAEKSLGARLSGGVDSATSYMRRSAYAESDEAVPEVGGAAVVFLHDFYDSPHVYPGMVFADFWEWVCFTIETLTAAGIPFFVKPHPNQIGLSEGVMHDLLRRYPHLAIIPQKVTNRQLVDAGMACAVTVYGSVAHEMAYLGVPSVACARHPHVSFDFCRTATSREGYADALRECTRMRVDRDSMRRQSLEFYYMHNLNLKDDEQALRNWAAEFRAASAKQGGIEVWDLLVALTASPGYGKYISMWSDDLGDAGQLEVSNVLS